MEKPNPSSGRVRNKASKRPIATQSVHGQFRDEPEVTFTDEDRHQLLVPLQISGGREDEIVIELENTAASYKRWRETPRSSREIAKRDLLELADFCDRMISDRKNDHRGLSQKCFYIDDLAQTCLWDALRCADEWPAEQYAVN